MADDEVCIGNRYRIGTALFEVTQPRVTCYRVGIRTGEPRMAALLTSAGRPGFYLRVLEEGEIGAGDTIVQVSSDRERLTVAEANALLYLPPHPRDRLERALRIPALSPGWRTSFEALLAAQDASAAPGGNAGLVPAAAARTAPPGFRRLRVSRRAWECPDVLSLSLEPTDGASLTVPLPGQFVVLRVRPDPGGPPLFRSYSLCGPPSGECYRLGVKVEPQGAAGQYLSARTQAGDAIEVSAPRGTFVLAPGDGPVVLLSAGIGATPVLSMLHALSAGNSTREVWWLHGARDRRSHPFASESLALTRGLSRARSHVVYSRPGPDDRPGRDFDTAGRLGLPLLQALGVPRDGDFYLCGPASFLNDLRTGLTASGISPGRVHAEVFAGGESVTPGIVSATHSPHVPPGRHGTGALVSFARSGVAVRWDPSGDRTLLELAEACDVSVRWSCRTGVCHTCESGLVSGRVTYSPEPLDSPEEGNLLPCCAQPSEDVVLDL